MENSFKLTEIWLIDKDIKDQSLKPNIDDILASEQIVWGPKRPQWAVPKAYGLGQAGQG